MIVLTGLRHVRTRVALLLLIVMGLSGSAFGAATPKEQRFGPIGRSTHGEVMILGSSSMNGVLGRTFVNNLRRRGLRVYKLGVASSGLSRPDYFDWLTQVRHLPITKRTSLAVLYLGGNDAQAIRLMDSARRPGKWVRFGARKWPKLYAARVARLAAALCKRGVRQVVYVLPADVAKSRLQRRLRPVRRGQLRGVRRVRCASAVSSRGDLRRIVNERLRRRTKRRRGRAARLRQPDGVHLTRAGAKVL
ncbi:MAG: DUF459 domain-containing protein, partial [Myxococcales bacterium]|nr:DUF459 domain-containing protein [Myxococcales bacterium]